MKLISFVSVLFIYFYKGQLDDGEYGRFDCSGYFDLGFVVLIQNWWERCASGTTFIQNWWLPSVGQSLLGLIWCGCVGCWFQIVGIMN